MSHACSQKIELIFKTLVGNFYSNHLIIYLGEVLAHLSGKLHIVMLTQNIYKYSYTHNIDTSKDKRLYNERLLGS